MDAGAPSRKRILLVDDDVPSARTLATMLREDGYDVEVAYDGALAIGRLSRGAMPDLLVTDYRMPHADGLAVASYARSRSPLIPVLLVTSYPEVVATMDGKMEPPLVIMAKPLSYTELTQELAKHDAK